MVEAQRVQSITNIIICIRDIKKILKFNKFYTESFNINILTTQEKKQHVKDLISLYRQLKEYLKNTNKIFDK